MKNRFKFLLIFLIILLDQLLKFYIKKNILPNQEIVLIPNVLSITNIRNSGAAWSILEGKTWIFITVTIIFIPIALYFLFFKSNHVLFFNLGLSMIIGGTIGNFIDRIFNKQVIDMLMLKFIDFPIFNIADVAINIGVLFLIIYIFQDGDNM